MQFNASTPRRPIVIQGQEFQAPAPYAEGHVLNANEASVLNQTLAENLRNNLASRLKPAEDGTVQGLTQEDFDAYAAEYEFGVRRAGGGGGVSLSPVDREARRIAREKINARLKELGKKIDTKTDEGKATMEKLVSDLAAKEPIRKQAQKNISATDKISLEELGGLDLAA